LLTNVNGAFDASLSDPRLYSGIHEGTMVNGIAQMFVYVPLDPYIDGTSKFNLNSIVVGQSGCGPDNYYTYGGFYSKGCQTIIATNETPKFGGSTGLRAQSNASMPTKYEIQNYPYLVIQEAYNNFNRFLFGTVGQREMIERVKAYDGSSTSILVGLLPFVGDTSDLLMQAYYEAFTTTGADPVVVTLGGVGLGVDFFTGVGGEAATGAKTVYKISKNLVVSLRIQLNCLLNLQ